MPADSRELVEAAERRLAAAEERVVELKARMRAASAGCRAAWDRRCEAETAQWEPEAAARWAAAALARLDPSEQQLVEERWAARSEQRATRQAVADAQQADRASNAGLSLDAQQDAENLTSAIGRANRIPPRLLVQRRFGGLVGEYEEYQPAPADDILDPYGVGRDRVCDPRVWVDLGLAPARADLLVEHLRVLRSALAHRDLVLADCHPADTWTPQQPLTDFTHGRVPRLPESRPGTWLPLPGTDEYWRKWERVWASGGGGPSPRVPSGEVS